MATERMITRIKARILHEWHMTLAELWPPVLWRLLVQGAKDTWRDIKELVRDADKPKDEGL